MRNDRSGLWQIYLPFFSRKVAGKGEKEMEAMDKKMEEECAIFGNFFNKNAPLNGRLSATDALPTNFCLKIQAEVFLTEF